MFKKLDEKIGRLRNRNKFLYYLLWKPQSKRLCLIINVITLMLIVLCAIGGLSIYQVYHGDFNSQPANFVTMKIFETYASQYENAPEIQAVAAKCKGDYDEVRCVFNNIPYDWTDHSGLMISVSDYFKSGGKGVCRDNAVIEKAALNLLNIPSQFVLKPEHIYVIANYRNYSYEINGYLTISKIGESQRLSFS